MFQFQKYFSQSGQVTEGEVLSQVAAVWSNSSGNVTIEVISDDFTTDPSPIIVPAQGLTIPAAVVSIASKEDFVAQGDRTVTVTIQASSSTGVNSPSSTFSVTIADDDSAGVTIAQSSGNTAVSEGGTTDTYTVVLTSQPTANVTMNLDGGAQLSLSTAVTFTPQNWNVPQTVTVSAVDDALVEGTHTQTINHTATSTDAKYNGISITSITANITDNDRNDAPSYQGQIKRLQRTVAHKLLPIGQPTFPPARLMKQARLSTSR